MVAGVLNCRFIRRVGFGAHLVVGGAGVRLAGGEHSADVMADERELPRRFVTTTTEAPPEPLQR